MPTDCKSVMAKVDKRVKLLRLKVPPIEPRVVLPRLVRPPAFWQIRSPVICCGPSMLIVPEASELTRTLPEMVEQEANPVASAWELMVAVD